MITPGRLTEALAPAVAAAVLAIVLAAPAAAQKQGMNRSQRDLGAALPAAGLTARFHDNAGCTPISSPYGAPTRYDGSSRATGGGPEATHGGIDLSLREATPLLAVAPGTIFAAGEGGRMEGIYLWLLHLPERSGLPFAFLAKYQHLSKRPTQPRGVAVALGQEVARSGSTGTTGGHYGQGGYSHLHLTVRAIADDKAALAARFDEAFSIQRDSIQIDPLTLYVPGLQSASEASSLPSDRRQVAIGYVDAGGVVRPPGARVVWPVSCP